MTISRSPGFPHPGSNTGATPEADYRFDFALAGWFVPHRVAWFGTAGELIGAVRGFNGSAADVWQYPARALYGHLESHSQLLHSLGVEVSVQPGLPRMLSLRPFQGQQPDQHQDAGIEATSTAGALGEHSDPPVPPPVLTNSGLAAPIERAEPACGTLIPESDAPMLPVTELPVTDIRSKPENGLSCAFPNVAETLSEVVEMRRQIQEHGLDLSMTMKLVVARAQEMSGASGVRIVWLRQPELVCLASVGTLSEFADPAREESFLRSCIRKGTVELVPDLQADATVRAQRKANSLIAAPIFRKQNVAGVLLLVFADARSFSSGDVMTMELITDLVGDRSSLPAPPDRIPDRGDLAKFDSNVPPALPSPAGAPPQRRKVWISLP